MQDVSGEGRTVLFVSHNLPAIQTLCSKAVILSQGRIRNSGPTEKMINEYLSIGSVLKGEVVNHSEPSDKKLMIRSARLCDERGHTSCEFERDAKAFLEIEAEVFVAAKNYIVGFNLGDSKHGVIFGSSFFDADVENRRNMDWHTGKHKFLIELPLSLLMEGEYNIQVGGTVPGIEILDIMADSLIFKINDRENLIFKGGEGRQGVVMPIIDWKTVKS
jgi:lipopolysaccharide transport system ATP-binding protein